jgi:hypothetical protein
MTAQRSEISSSGRWLRQVEGAALTTPFSEIPRRFGAKIRENRDLLFTDEHIAVIIKLFIVFRSLKILLVRMRVLEGGGTLFVCYRQGPEASRWFPHFDCAASAGYFQQKRLGGR